MKGWISLAAMLGVISACEAQPNGPTAVGHLVASLQGDVAGSYAGTGQFSVGRNARAPQRPATFVLRSTGEASGKQEGFYLYRLGPHLPTPGLYSLGETNGFAARYERIHNGVREGYTAVMGDLEITAATSDRIEGTFRLTAVLNCAGTISAMSCQAPAPLQAPRIEMTGSFTAVEDHDSHGGVLRM